MLVSRWGFFFFFFSVLVTVFFGLSQTLLLVLGMCSTLSYPGVCPM